MKKHKLIIDPRVDPREDFDGKLRIEQFGGGAVDGSFLVPDEEQLAEAMEGADWSNDPGTGRAILLQDGRELLNPVPVAPPISISSNTEPSVNDLVERALKRHFEQLKADDEIDTLEDADDFGEDEDFVPISQFEIMLREEAPAIPVGDVSEEAIADVAEAEAALPPAPAKPAPKPKAPKKELDEEGAP